MEDRGNEWLYSYHTNYITYHLVCMLHNKSRHVDLNCSQNTKVMAITMTLTEPIAMTIARKMAEPVVMIILVTIAMKVTRLTIKVALCFCMDSESGTFVR